MTLLKKSLAVLFYIITALLIFFSLYFNLSPNHVMSVKGQLAAFAFIGLALTLATVFAAGSVKAPKRRLTVKISLSVLFTYYLFILLFMLFFDHYFGRTNSMMFQTDAAVYIHYNTNFIPFKTILNYISSWRLHTINQSTILTNLFGNLAAFAPMGVFLPLLFKPMRKFIPFSVSVGLFIIAVEITQLLTFTGSCDIDDFILNFTGALLAYAFTKMILFHRILKNGDDRSWRFRNI